MKHILVVVTFFISSFAMAQNNGSISGHVLDIESENMPLAFAKILIKETGAETISDENGDFKFENLKGNTYTLVFSFIGYETKSTQTKVVSNKITKVKQHIGASSVSLDDLVMVFASADNNDTSSSN